MDYPIYICLLFILAMKTFNFFILLLFSVRIIFLLRFYIRFLNNLSIVKMAKENDVSRKSTKQFPDDFLLGTATGSFQVEGAWDEDKTPSVWDEYFHNQSNRKFRYSLDIPMSVINEYKRIGVQPRLIDIYKGMGVYEIPKTAATVVDDIGSQTLFNGDVAADAYHKTDTDVMLLKELGVQVYRFSLCPTRILPNIIDHLPCDRGINYYNDLIDKLIENGITPMVSLYHYDFPAAVNVMGGLTNAITIKFFVQYARLCFDKFGDRVKYWILSPDIQMSAEGYSSGHFAPGYDDQSLSGFIDYIVLHNKVKSVATVYKVYNEEYRFLQRGEVSIAIDGTWYYPQDPNNPEHRKIAEFARMTTFGMIVHVLATGQYPSKVLEAIDRNNKKEGIIINRLQQLSETEGESIKGSFDFIVFNYYSCVKVRPMTEEELLNEPNLKRKDRGFIMNFENISADEVNNGFLNCLKWITSVMNNPKIFIGENGFAEDEGVDNSQNKISYHKGILHKLLEALDENINVFGYCVWSFVDTLEFTFGYRKKFGIYAVDFNDESRPRLKKNSFSFFQRLFQTKQLNYD